ncbi:MAG: hypothetical protein K2Q18_04870, partial [Bdellovibrionales bacterium]|nr:hypothetical protein [Bdellovibrionales bacterium]
YVMKSKIFSVLVLFIGLVGCSRLDLAANLANSYIVNKTDDFFDLNRDQKKIMREALEDDLAKIKKSILPQLASELHRNAEIISSTKKIDKNDVLLSYQRIENIFYQSIRIFSADAVTLADKLSQEQINYFQEESQKKLEELKEKPGKKSFDRMKKHFDSWLGTMTASQKSELKNFIATNPPSIAETIHFREVMVQDFVKVYPDKEARRKYVENIFNNYESIKGPIYARIMNEKTQKVAEFVTRVLNTMTEDQRNTLIHSLRDRANQLIKISKSI